MDRCYTLVCVTVFVASVIHGFTVGVRYGNRIAIKDAMENVTGASDRGESLSVPNSTTEFLVLQTGPDPAIAAAMAGCIKALKASTDHLEAAAAAFEASDASTQGQAFDDLRAEMSAALELSRACVKDCFVDSEGAHQLQSACASQMRSHTQAWEDAEDLCLQFLDVEFNRMQLTSRWSSSSNDSSEP